MIFTIIREPMTTESSSWYLFELFLYLNSNITEQKIMSIFCPPVMFIIMTGQTRSWWTVWFCDSHMCQMTCSGSPKNMHPIWNLSYFVVLCCVEYWSISSWYNSLSMNVHTQMPHLHGLSGTRAWRSNYIHVKQWGIITHPSPNFNGNLVKPPL